jgi:hypothetical protein
MGLTESQALNIEKAVNPFIKNLEYMNSEFFERLEIILIGISLKEKMKLALKLDKDI